MKITTLEAIVLRQDEEIKLIGDGSQDSVLIKIETDEGITGWGEVDSSPYIVREIVHCPPSHIVCRGLRDVVVGQDPFDVEKIWHDMYTASFYYGRRGVGIHAMSGVDIALWDIMGKATGKPIYKLLGGKFHDKIRAYASLLMPETEEEVYEKVKKYTDQGFTALKFGWGGLGQSKEQDISLVKAAREALGTRELMLDIGYLWQGSKYAAEMCNLLGKFSPYWIEEPLISDDLEGFAYLSKRTSLSIAAGETLTTLYEFKELLEKGVDIVQPDISRCGGLTIAKKIADLASCMGRKCVPHAFKSGILMAATVQFLTAYSKEPLLEFCCQETILSRSLIKEPFRIDADGYVTPPDKPGLGVEIEMDILEKLRV
jgi:L-alanine-DL-glutamate epimerase-like enolase superfamily enzyme